MSECTCFVQQRIPHIVYVKGNCPTCLGMEKRIAEANRCIEQLDKCCSDRGEMLDKYETEIKEANAAKEDYCHALIWHKDRIAELEAENARLRASLDDCMREWNLTEAECDDDPNEPEPML